MQKLFGDNDESRQVRPQVLDGGRLSTWLVGVDAAADVNALRLVLHAQGRLPRNTQVVEFGELSLIPVLTLAAWRSG